MLDNSVNQIYSVDVWEHLESNPAAVLVDVRTPEEWKNVGVPDISSIDKTPVFIPWVDAFGTPNPVFIEQLQKNITPDQKVFFMCRGGSRSQAAALAALAVGIENVYNIVHGFEGVAEQSENSKHSGWREVGLPWRKL